ncbi:MULTISPECIES: hypothetical protein [unclassified Dolichospermum]|jgi:predicted site-specific integrase-resolvase|uniref:hypothetical protein n=1 Tax=unclassified Dolichospermum TaxID=2622029 RepID=UPI001C2C704F|nr:MULTISPECIES: hypothetical protein [unclassified Dolichospermum]
MWKRGELNATQLTTGTVIVNFDKPINKGVVNLATERTDDLMHDFVSIITSFCARLYSIRRRTRKTECIIECLQEDECN